MCDLRQPATINHKWFGSFVVCSLFLASLNDLLMSSFVILDRRHFVTSSLRIMVVAVLCTSPFLSVDAVQCFHLHHTHTHLISTWRLLLAQRATVTALRLSQPEEEKKRISHKIVCEHRWVSVEFLSLSASCSGHWEKSKNRKLVNRKLIKLKKKTNNVTASHTHSHDVARARSHIHTEIVFNGMVRWWSSGRQRKKKGKPNK